MKRKTTRPGWIDGSLKPVREGVYERDLSDADERAEDPLYSKWQNGAWYTASLDVGRAHKEKHASIYQSLPWRGKTK